MEQRPVVAQLRCLAVLDQKNVDGLAVDVTVVEELDMEIVGDAAPDLLVGVEADGAELVVVELLQGRVQFGERLERLRGDRFRHFLQNVPREWRRSRSVRPLGQCNAAVADHGCQTGEPRGGQKTASVHGGFLSEAERLAGKKADAEPVLPKIAALSIAIETMSDSRRTIMVSDADASWST